MSGIQFFPPPAAPGGGGGGDEPATPVVPAPHYFILPNGLQTVHIYQHTLTERIPPGDSVTVLPSWGPDSEVTRNVAVFVGRDDLQMEIAPAGFIGDFGTLQVIAGNDLDGNFSIRFTNNDPDFGAFNPGTVITLRASANNTGEWL